MACDLVGSVTPRKIPSGRKGLSSVPTTLDPPECLGFNWVGSPMVGNNTGSGLLGGNGSGGSGGDGVGTRRVFLLPFLLDVCGSGDGSRGRFMKFQTLRPRGMELLQLASSIVV